MKTLQHSSRHPPVGPLALRSPRPEPRHGSVCAALVHEHQPARVQAPYTLAPATPLFLVAFRGGEGLFLSGNPSLSKARLIVAVETLIPCASSKSSQCSSSVRSGLASAWAGSAATSAAPFLAGGPGTGLGSTSPLSLRSLR